VGAWRSAPEHLLISSFRRTLLFWPPNSDLPDLTEIPGHIGWVFADSHGLIDTGRNSRQASPYRIVWAGVRKEFRDAAETRADSDQNGEFWLQRAIGILGIGRQQLSDRMCAARADGALEPVHARTDA
jgi:hypothetical protein